MSLTNTAIANAKPQAAQYRMADGDGLSLLVMPTGAKLWRFRYRWLGKERMISLGKYPEVSLADAREKCREARKTVSQGIDPSAHQQELKRQAHSNQANTLEAVAKEWHGVNYSKWTPQHSAKVLRRLELHVFPALGGRPIAEIKPPELLAMLRKIEERDTTEILRRVNQTCAAIFSYGIITGKCEINPAAHLRGALKAHKAVHYPTLTARELPAFLKALEEVKTSDLNRLAVKLLMLTFVRTGEMRKARWADINMQAKEWVIPAAHTKMRREHLVPLSRQALEVLEALRETTNKLGNPHGLLLPSQNRQKNLIMSENTINLVLAKMGYKGRLVGHGFRALASTILNEQGHRADVIERQLAHKEPNAVRAAYNRAEYLSERVKLMQAWADYLSL